MDNPSTIMTRFDTVVAQTIRGELATFGLAGGAGALSWMEAITPILALAGVILGIIAGVYTILIKRKQLSNYNDQMK